MLQGVVTLTVIAAARDSLIHDIPSLNLAATGLHHPLNPLAHGIYQCVMTLLLSKRNGGWHIYISQVLADGRSLHAATVCLNLK